MRPAYVLAAGLATLLPLLSVAPVSGASGLAAETLTPGPETYVVASRATDEVTIRAVAPADGKRHDWNRREILVSAGATPSRDQSVCATWTDESRRLDQQGLAVRYRAGPGGRSRAITLTKNTYAGYVWVFNLLTWDTRRPGVAWRALGQFDMSPVVSSHLKLLPLPWQVCLRVQGRQVDFKVWLPGREPEPAWTDAVHSRSAQVPRRFRQPGLPGWYVGHLRPGDQVTYTEMSAESAPGR